jgi:DNA-binding IclR family transcriptional regulator
MRALDVLEHVGVANRPIPLYFLCESLRLKKQTVYNTVRTLTERGYLARAGRRGLYRVGPALTRVYRIQSDYDMLQRAVRWMLYLSRRTEAEVVLGEYVGREVVAVLRIPRETAEFPVNFAPSTLHPYGTSLLFHAWWSPAQLRDYRARHPFSESDTKYWKTSERLDRFLAGVRRQGYLVLPKKDFRVAAPVFDGAGNMRAMIAIMKERRKIPREDEKAYVALVRQAAREITSPAPA